MKFNGEVVLITGASSGIGAACACLFTGQGARVVVNYRASRANAEAVVEQIRQSGGQAWACQADVTVTGDVRRMVDWISENVGPVDVLVNNVGGPVNRVPFWDCSEELWDDVVSVNLKSVFLCTQAVLGGMMKRSRGAIVNVTSYSARNGGAANGSIPYGAAKGGVEAMTKGLARDLASAGIRVNAVAPGVVDTPLILRTPGDERYGTPEVFLKRVAAMTPIKRAASPEEIARVIVFVASSDASYMTGQVVDVTGGL